MSMSHPVPLAFQHCNDQTIWFQSCRRRKSWCEEPKASNGPKQEFLKLGMDKFCFENSPAENKNIPRASIAFTAVH